MITNAYSKLKYFLFEAQEAQESGLSLALMRIFLCSTMLFLAISRQFNIDQYSLESFVPRSEALSIYPEFYRPAIEYFFWPDQWAWLVHLGYIFLLLVAVLGLSNRVLMLITWVIAQGFINRNYSMLFGADLISALFLFYLSFTQCHDYFSLKNLFKKGNLALNRSNSEFSTQVSRLFFRLMQVQICVIYAYTGFEKLKGSTWWDGTALWTVFANPQFISFDFIFLRNFPLFFSIGTFTTIIFEVYFPTMMLYKPLKKYWLFLGVIFHMSIGILLGLLPFSFVMMSTYFLFLDKEFIEKFILKCHDLIQNKIFVKRTV